MTAIPVLDGGLSDGDLAAAFLSAYAEVGFAYLENHGVEARLLDGIFEASRAFHALPLAEKTAIALDGNHRGYIALGTSTDVNSDYEEISRPNQSESFMMMREDAAPTSDYLSGPNQWPALAGFRETCEAYHAAMSALGLRMMRVAARALGAPPGAFDDSFSPPTTWLRLLRYPPAPKQRPEDLYGSAPHNDFGCLTLLAQDEVGGLQVMSTAGEWLDVPPRAGAFIVNVGDMLHRWSNGVLRSTPHRVINASGRERYSCPFFFDPHVSAEIAPLAATVTAARPAAFAPLVFGDFLRAELEAGYEAHGGAEPTGRE